MASIKDRTQEFHSAVESLRSRASNTALERRSLLASPPKGSKRHNELNSKSEFSLMAGQIGKEINLVAAKLEKLTKLAKRKTIFDDKPVEISELTFIIKQDIGKLNKQIAQLQDYVRTAKGPSKQASEHSSNVVVLLQSKLASTSMSFKDVLEIRTENMKASKNRREQFMFSAAEQSSPRPTISTSSPSDYMPTAASELHHRRKTHSNSPLLNPDRRVTNGLMTSTSLTDNDSTLGLGIPMITPDQQAQMMVTQQDQYIETRATAIESIESTIAELGNIFQQLAQMVAEQREQVQRIDQNTDDIESNISGAQKELLKYYNNISSNRWLMIKIFATIVFFALLMAIMS